MLHRGCSSAVSSRFCIDFGPPAATTTASVAATSAEQRRRPDAVHGASVGYFIAPTPCVVSNWLLHRPHIAVASLLPCHSLIAVSVLQIRRRGYRFNSVATSSEPPYRHTILRRRRRYMNKLSSSRSGRQHNTVFLGVVYYCLLDLELRECGCMQRVVSRLI